MALVASNAAAPDRNVSLPYVAEMPSPDATSVNVPLPARFSLTAEPSSVMPDVQAYVPVGNAGGAPASAVGGTSGPPLHDSQYVAAASVEHEPNEPVSVPVAARNAVPAVVTSVPAVDVNAVGYEAGSGGNPLPSPPTAHCAKP